MATYYDLLGVAPSATHDELRRAYHRRAQLVHPDRHLGAPADVMAEADRALKQLNEAWSVLGDPERRRQYDASMTELVRPGQPRGQSPSRGTQLALGIALAVIGALLVVDSLGRGFIVTLVGLAFFIVGTTRAAKR